MRPADRAVCISIHDVAPETWPACARLLDLVDGLEAGPLTLLVVPDYHHHGRIDADSAFLRALERRLARGDEIALHGYTHLDEATAARGPWEWTQRRMLTQSEGEFAAISLSEARARLEQGYAMMTKLGWRVDGFVAPAWLLGDGARAALADFPFSYTTTRLGFYRLPDWRYHLSPTLVYSARSGWRRAMSLALNRTQLGALKTKSLVRLSLHPVDAHHEPVMCEWKHLIERSVVDRVPMTKAQWAAQLN